MQDINNSALVDLLESKDVNSANISRFLEMKARARGIPLNGSFELTPLCNLNCKMCYVHLTEEQMGQECLLSKDQWLSLMEQAVKKGMLYATLTGGECLTYPEFDELLTYLQSQAVRTSILTNGVLLSEERIYFLKQHRVSAIQITMYGSNDDIYEKVTGKRVFGLVLSNIKNALAAGLSVKVGITPSIYTENDSINLLHLLSELHIPFSLNSHLYAARPETGRNLTDYDQPIKEYIALRSEYMRHRNIILPAECDNNTPLISSIGIKCGAGNSGFNIDWRGKMYACSMIPDIVAEPLKIGFANAWAKINARAQEYPNPVECQKCKYKTVCTKCLAAHRSGAKPGHANPRICEIAKRITDHIANNCSLEGENR